MWPLMLRMDSYIRHDWWPLWFSYYDWADRQCSWSVACPTGRSPCGIRHKRSVCHSDRYPVRKRAASIPPLSWSRPSVSSVQWDKQRRRVVPPVSGMFRADTVRNVHRHPAADRTSIRRGIRPVMWPQRSASSGRVRTVDKRRSLRWAGRNRDRKSDRGRTRDRGICRQDSALQ